ncbi:hypothetical protein POVCU2_0035030 [Plasmodium ovale curtisi]|uniref:Uncharacterized protein n=1 Tax=Plasmodium ovale curtisi TaxID=864141 RepID=A0A1A8W4I6_PLAOA|nr:hypothetical protein POVCU2_0035030 [Plasmodium ovale curtisi]SBS96330.1 hypothetical protein POVCU1_032120 [Plasmodium ovale curtisi]
MKLPGCACKSPSLTSTVLTLEVYASCLRSALLRRPEHLSEFPQREGKLLCIAYLRDKFSPLPKFLPFHTYTLCYIRIEEELSMGIYICPYKYKLSPEKTGYNVYWM